MKIDIRTENLELTPTIRGLVDDKVRDPLDQLMKDFEKDLKQAKLEIARRTDNNQYETSLNLWLPGKEQIYADSKEEHLEFALTQLREKVEQQIKKYREELNADNPHTKSFPDVAKPPKDPSESADVTVELE